MGAPGSLGYTLYEGSDVYVYLIDLATGKEAPFSVSVSPKIENNSNNSNVFPTFLLFGGTNSNPYAILQGVRMSDGTFVKAWRNNGRGSNGGQGKPGVLFGFSGTATLALSGPDGLKGGTIEVDSLANHTTPTNNFVTTGKSHGLEASIGYSFNVIIHNSSFNINDFAGSSTGGDFNISVFGLGISSNWSSYFEFKIGVGIGAGASWSQTNTTVNKVDQKTNNILNEVYFRNTQF